MPYQPPEADDGKSNADELSDWTILPGDSFDPADVEMFTAEAWRAHHVERDHDLSYDWESRPVILIASDGEGRIAGVAEGRIGAGVGHLSELIVDRRLRGRGIGGRLLTAFEAHCREARCHKLTVMTELNGPAMAFYQHRGWRAEAIFERDRGGLDFVRLVKHSEDGALASADGEGGSE